MGWMRVVRAVLAAGLLWAASTGVLAQSPEQDAAAVEKALRDWTEAFNTGRVDRVCDLFAPELIAHYRGQPEKTHDSLCTALQADLGGGPKQYRYELDLHEIIVSGDLAVARFIWTLTARDRAGGATERSADRGIDIFRRQPDGAWRIIRFIGYPIAD
ncbi:MAG: nuclear transport factor 2 family protein [Alphaproteobacteria bacterium]|nr:nuclear transport factor 2 family protein [Alphaproteobacteria bacterium]